MKKLKLFIILPLIACIFCGCWDQKIYEKIGFMLSIGVDESPNGLALTYISPLIDPEQPGKLVEIAKAEDMTLTREARERGRFTTSKSIEAGTVQHYLVSSAIAANGMDDLLSIFEREAIDSIQPYVIVVDGSPRELLEKAAKFKNKPRASNYIKELLEHSIESSYAPETRIYNYDINYFSGTTDSIMPIIKSEPEQIRITGSALFHKDKMVGRITQRETSILLALMGKMKTTGYSCKTIDNLDVDSKKIIGVAVALKKPKRKIKITIENGKPIVNISLNFIGACDEGKWGLDFNDEKTKTMLENKIAANIKDDCTLVLDKCQRAGSDPIGIGEILRSKYPNYWAKTTWLEAYENTVFKVDVKVHIDSHGLIN